MLKLWEYLASWVTEKKNQVAEMIQVWEECANVYNLLDYDKGFGFESEWYAKVLESVEQRSDAIWCTF